MSILAEHVYSCPYCGESITGMVDLSIDTQRYIEDCEVCCQPIEIFCVVAAGDITNFVAARGDE